MRDRDRLVCLVLFALLLRLLCGLHPYSGQRTPPRFGDYEAQRHWMEIAVGMPARLWYVNTTDNDLGYWGLDYPPLSGYQSWLYGKLLERAEPAAVALRSSRGYETPSSKTLMRWTVVLSDLVCFLPPALAAARVFGAGELGQLRVAAMLLLNPAQLLIDHGHFQYNGISLGLAAGAAAAAAAGHHVLGSVLYCLSLGHKQMSLYYAPAFFAYLLASCLRRPPLAGKVGAVAKLGVTVLFTMALLWLPYLGSIDSALSVVRRVFPTKRGLYEDYVANFWCVSSLLIKWRTLLPAAALIKLCTAATAAAFLPSMWLQFRDLRGQRLLASLALCALAFYQFSFQVHEKSILLALLPLAMLPSEHLLPAACATAVGVFSMGPLLSKDGLVPASLALLAIYAAVVSVLAGWQPRAWKHLPSGARYVGAASAVGMACLAAAAGALAPPARLPYLWDALTMAWAYPHFLAMFLYLHVAV